MNDQNSDQTPTSPNQVLADIPVALIGLGGLFPRSGNLREFWGNVVDAADCIEDVPETHWRVDDYYDPDPGVPDKTYAKRGGFLPTVSFDPMEFGLPPNTLEVTDVLQLLSLVVAKQTLIDAGATDARRYDPSRTGVILGVTGANALSQPLSARLQTPVLKEVVRSCGLSDEDAEHIAAKFVAAFPPWEENSFPGMLGNVVAGRIANRFNFGGINCTLDAACASSLAAVRMAASELVSGRADLMLTGGCDAENTILMYMCFSKTPAFSRNGLIRPFDEDSDGTLIGEGIGMVALKRLADAERDGDRIYAVLRGLGSSSDGRFKSIYAPRQDGQVMALCRGYEDAKIGPDTVGLMECHGTGTSVGDLVELSALREVYQGATDEKQFCAVGSVKSQIGHTKGAAGAAGLIKVALALHQKVLPPTINVDRPREAVDFPNSPFYVNSESRPWILDPARPVRRGAISSFGFGGTNFHCILQEHDPAGADVLVLHRANRVHVWHAPDSRALLSVVEADPAGMSDTTPVPDDHARLAVVAKDEHELASRRAEAVVRLREAPEADAFELPGVHYGARTRSKGKIAALFAGQGSQYVGMGAATALGTPIVRAEFDAMSLTCSGSLAKVIFPPPAFDRETKAAQEATLRRTEHAQPALGALSAGQFRYLRELGLRVEGTLGHSYGELVALWAAGALDDNSFRKLSVARGSAMASLPNDQSDPGTMAAVRATPVELADHLAAHPDVVVCNLNAPDQTVVGGGSDAVRGFVDAVKGAGIGAQLLPVAAAFHTRYVAHAVDDFADAVASAEWREPEIAVYPNTDGAEYSTDLDRNRAVLVDQMVNPVAFAPRVRQMYDEGYRTFVEFGPRSTLSRLVRGVLEDVAEDVTVLTADGGTGGDGDFALKQLAARLIVLGCPLTEPNRYVAAETAAPPGKGMRISLNGANYVPEERRRRYRDMLENGYRVAPPEPAEAASAAAARSDESGSDQRYGKLEVNMHGASSGQAGSPPSAPLRAASVAHEHLSLHRDYLDSQLRVVERLSNVLAQHSEHGVPSDNVVRGIAAVSEHGVAIGQSHIHASEVLRAFAYLDAGAPMPVEHHALDEHRNGRAPYSYGNMSLESPRQEIDSGRPDASDVTYAPSEISLADEVVVGNGAGSAGEANDVVAESARFDAGVQPAAEPATATERVRQVLLDIVSEKTGYPADMLDTSMDLEADLGIDSIKRVEIMGGMAERFPGGPMPLPEQLGELRTLDDITTLISGTGQSEPNAESEVVADPKAEGASGIARMRARLIPLPAVDRLVGAYADQPVAFVTGSDTPLAARTVEALRSTGWAVHIGTEVPEDVSRLDLVVLFAVEIPATWSEATAVMAGGLALAGRTQPLLETAAEHHRASFVTVTMMDGALGLYCADEPAGLLGGLPGLVKTLAVEAPALFCRSVDLAADLAEERAVELLLGELQDSDAGLTQVGITADGGRCTVGVENAGTVDDLLGGDGGTEPGPDDLLVVTGGARGVTAACAIGLARRFRTGLLLLGRTPLTDAEPAWAQGVPPKRLRAAIAAELRARNEKPAPREVERIYRDLSAQREVRETLATIRDAGAVVEYLPLDITDREATEKRLADYRDRITGVIHGAGVLADRLIVDKRDDEVRQVLDVKLTGLSAVLDAMDEQRLRHVLLFASVAGFFGNRGQSDYAMANEALNRVAVSLSRRLPSARVTSVNWGAWAGGMVTPELQRMFHQRGVPLIPLERGVDLFLERLTAARSTDVVWVIGPTAPLSVSDVATPRGDLVLVRRDIRSLAREPAMADHAIDGSVVLPATAAMGAMLDVVRRALPGRTGAGLRKFAVLKGLVLDGSAPEHLDFELTPGAESTAVIVRDAEGRPRYQAEVMDTVTATTALAQLPAAGGGEPAEVYRGAALFHGPSLQGIHRVLAEDGGNLVLQCRLRAVAFANGAYGTEDYHPLLADVLLQAALVCAHRSTGMRSLPSAVGAAEVHEAIPSGEPFLVVVSDVHVSAPIVRCHVTACAPDGTVLLRLRDVEVVTSNALDGKFASRG